MTIPPLKVPKQKELPSLVTRSWFLMVEFYLKILIFSIKRAPRGPFGGEVICVNYFFIDLANLVQIMAKGTIIKTLNIPKKSNGYSSAT